MLLTGAMLCLGISGLALGWAGYKLGTKTTPSRLYQGIRAQRFILNDKKGKPRAVLDMAEGAGPGLYFYDEQGQIRASIYMTKDGKPWLELSDEGGKPRAALNVTDNRGGAYLYDEYGTMRWQAP